MLDSASVGGGGGPGATAAFFFLPFLVGHMIGAQALESVVCEFEDARDATPAMKGRIWKGLTR